MGKGCKYRQKMNRILTRFGEINRIAAIMGVSRPTVRSALSGKTSSDLAKRIRKAALERGGVEVNN